MTELRFFNPSNLAPGASQVVKNPPANAGDARDSILIPGHGRSPGEGNGSPLQYSCLEDSMDRGAWWATVRGVTEALNRTERAHAHNVYFNVAAFLFCTRAKSVIRKEVS